MAALTPRRSCGPAGAGSPVGLGIARTGAALVAGVRREATGSVLLRQFSTVS